MSKPMTKEIAQKMLQSSEESLRDLALLHYPELGSIMDQVKTYKDACRITGEYPDLHQGLSKAEIAYRKLCVIIKALNEGWKPCFWDRTQYKYSPYFRLEDGHQVFYYVYDWYSSTDVPATSLFKSRELAEKIALENQDLYGQMLFGL